MLLDKLRYMYGRFVGAVAEGAQHEEGGGRRGRPRPRVERRDGQARAAGGPLRRAGRCARRGRSGAWGCRADARVQIYELPVAPQSLASRVGRLLGVHAEEPGVLGGLEGVPSAARAGPRRRAVGADRAGVAAARGCRSSSPGRSGAHGDEVGGGGGVPAGRRRRRGRRRRGRGRRDWRHRGGRRGQPGRRCRCRSPRPRPPPRTATAGSPARSSTAAAAADRYEQYPIARLIAPIEDHAAGDRQPVPAVLARERRGAILGHAERLPRLRKVATGGVLSRSVSRWRRYWFAEGGRYTAAALRVAIAASVLLSLWRLWGLRPLAAPDGVYRPVGVWMALGHARPPDELVDALWAVAWASSALMLVGLLSRVATAASFLASACSRRCRSPATCPGRTSTTSCSSPSSRSSARARATRCRSTPRSAAGAACRRATCRAATSGPCGSSSAPCR